MLADLAGILSIVLLLAGTAYIWPLPLSVELGSIVVVALSNAFLWRGNFGGARSLQDAARIFLIVAAVLVVMNAGYIGLDILSGKYPDAATLLTSHRACLVSRPRRSSSSASPV